MSAFAHQHPACYSMILLSTYCGFGMIELDTSRKTTLSQQPQLRDDELVDLPGVGSQYLS